MPKLINKILFLIMVLMGPKLTHASLETEPSSVTEQRELGQSTERELLTGEWQACSSISGTCIDTSRYQCSGGTRTGLCPGPTQVRCCPAPHGVRSAACTNGVCMHTATCSYGTTRTGLCPGPWSVTCCASPSPTPPTSAQRMALLSCGVCWILRGSVWRLCLHVLHRIRTVASRQHLCCKTKWQQWCGVAGLLCLASTILRVSINFEYYNMVGSCFLCVVS